MMTFDKSYAIMESHLGGFYVCDPDMVESYEESCETCGDWDRYCGEVYLDDSSYVVPEIFDICGGVSETVELAEEIGCDKARIISWLEHYTDNLKSEINLAEEIKEHLVNADEEC